MSSPSQRRRAGRHIQPQGETNITPVRRGSPGDRRAPITVEAIVQAAFEIVAQDGYEALSMRRVATALDTGPASLYAHVINKEDLDDLLIGQLCSEIEIPEPDPTTWSQQIHGVCAQLRDQYLRYPGISRAALAIVPTNLETLRVSEGMLAILLAGGVAPQVAAWTIDALTLYINAYCLEYSLVNRQAAGDARGWLVSREELVRRFAALPDTFPQTRRYAAELTAGEGHERFDFTITLMIEGLQTRGTPLTGVPS